MKKRLSSSRCCLPTATRTIPCIKIPRSPATQSPQELGVFEAFSSLVVSPTRLAASPKSRETIYVRREGCSRYLWEVDLACLLQGEEVLYHSE
jgi:hypothetical protein